MQSEGISCLYFSQKSTSTSKFRFSNRCNGLFSLVDTLPERIPDVLIDVLEHGGPLHSAVLFVKSELVVGLIRLTPPL